MFLRRRKEGSSELPKIVVCSQISGHQRSELFAERSQLILGQLIQDSQENYREANGSDFVPGWLMTGRQKNGGFQKTSIFVVPTQI